MKWTVAQCQSQAAGIATLEALKSVRSLTKSEKQTLAIAKSHYSAYGCKRTLASVPPSPSSPSNSGLSLTSQPSTPAANMGLFDSVVGVVQNVLGTGRAETTTGPDTNDTSLLGTLGTVAGTVIGSVFGQPAIGGVLGGNIGTLGDTTVNTTGNGTGRANTTALIPLEAMPGMSPAQTYDSAVTTTTGRRRMPSTSKVRRLVRCVGVVNAASMLGLAIPLTAMIACRPYRRRGISAASLRITRRTIRQVNSITKSLSHLKHCRR